MFDQVTSDIKEAMKAKEKERLNALRYLKSLLLENKTSGKPKPEIDVVV
ncbi:MAG: glutamyl-tRNA amidotransferase, partial [Halobacteriovoraceae bacterium]|nr:glutamyl-tRNA amidotransferase [Halobacteriovoraceae bacterium]